MSRFAPQEGKENLQSLVGKVFVVTGEYPYFEAAFGAQSTALVP